MADRLSLATKAYAVLATVLLIGCLGILFSDRWMSRLGLVSPFREGTASDEPIGRDVSNGQANTDHGHSHPGHREETAIKLSEQARKNIGLEMMQIELGPFERTVGMPAMIVERPGRSLFDITAPFTGSVMKIHAIEGEAVAYNQPLFELRLTHEDLVTAQSEFLRIAEELRVVEREIERLNAITEGVIAGKTILNREYEQQKLTADFRAKRQKLILHGLTEEQIENIHATGELLRRLIVTAPDAPEESTPDTNDTPLHVQELKVKQGQHVAAGESLCVLADHRELFIEGSGFDDDFARLNRAAEEGWDVSAVLLAKDDQRFVERGLKILYIADQVEPGSRALRFYVKLPNRLIRETTTPDGRRFIAWRYRPGQRVELLIPVEQWEEQIVVPVESIVEEGSETFVFQQNGDHFDRLPVHVKFRDQTSAVIANDGSLFPGDTIATYGAYQMHQDMKNKAGGAIDPHAGHSH